MPLGSLLWLVVSRGIRSAMKAIILSRPLQSGQAITSIAKTELYATGPPLPAARGAPPSIEPPPAYDVADPVYEE